MAVTVKTLRVHSTSLRLRLVLFTRPAEMLHYQRQHGYRSRAAVLGYCEKNPEALPSRRYFAEVALLVPTPLDVVVHESVHAAHGLLARLRYHRLGALGDEHPEEPLAYYTGFIAERIVRSIQG